jgi:hypothetical protein
MQALATLYRLGALCVLVLAVLIPQRSELRGDTAAPVPGAPGPKPEQLAQAELTESYRRIQEQLRATQTEIIRNRLEAESLASTQSAAFAEKLDMIQRLMTAENRQQQAVAERAEFERSRQLAEMQETHGTILWVATAFGCVGMLAMLLAVRFQWKTINRLAEAGDARLYLTASGQAGLLPSGADLPAAQSVTQANQRLNSAISRMERRIIELENTAHPLPIAKSVPVVSSKKVMA